MSLVPQEYWETIKSLKKTIVCLVSGGTESTALAYECYKQGLDNVILLFCDTGLEFPQVYEILNKISADTGYKLEIVEAADYIKRWNWTVAQILIRSYEKYLSSDIQTDLPCRYNLKLNPMKRFSAKNYPDAIFISGIAPYESRQRRMFLTKIRKQNTFFHSKWKLTYSYPLRDCFSPKVIPKYLRDNNLDVQSSFCVLCPINFFKTIGDFSTRDSLDELLNDSGQNTLIDYLSNFSDRYKLADYLTDSDLNKLATLLTKTLV